MEHREPIDSEQGVHAAGSDSSDGIDEAISELQAAIADFGIDCEHISDGLGGEEGIQFILRGQAVIPETWSDDPLIDHEQLCVQRLKLLSEAMPPSSRWTIAWWCKDNTVGHLSWYAPCPYEELILQDFKALAEHLRRHAPHAVHV